MGGLVNRAIDLTFGKPQAPWQRSALQLLYSMNAAIRLITKNGGSHIYLCRGTAKITSKPLTVQFNGKWKIGDDNSLAFYEHLFFEHDSIERIDLGTCRAGTMHQVAREVKEQVDLFAVHANPLLLLVPHTGIG